MKLNVTKEWCLAMAKKEAGCEVGAGHLAHNPIEECAQALSLPHGNETRAAFGSLVALMRRDAGLTREQLADKADVDAADIVNIEADNQYLPEPRTVYKLANVFNISSKRLLQLSGNAIANDQRFREEAVRFAARSGSMERLTPEEQKALREFIKILSEDL